MAVTIKKNLQNTEMHETQIKRYREIYHVSLNILFGSILVLISICSMIA